MLGFQASPNSKTIPVPKLGIIAHNNFVLASYKNELGLRWLIQILILHKQKTILSVYGATTAIQAQNDSNVFLWGLN